MTWNPESKTVLDSLTWGDIRKKFKGVAHSSGNTSSRFCLNVLKLMIWTGSIYFKANLTFSFACLSKNNLRFRRSNFEQTFRWTKATLYYFISLASSTSLAYEQALLFWGSREKSRESGHEFEGFRCFLARSWRLKATFYIFVSNKYLWAMNLTKFTRGFRVVSCLQANSSKYR